MKRVRMLAVATLFAVVALSSDATFAQSTTVKDQLIGTWTLIAADSLQKDGSKAEVFGPSPRGILIFTSDGRFALVQMRSDLPKIASNSRDKATPEETSAIVSGSIAYYGTYSVNEAEKLILVRIEASTFPNIASGAEQSFGRAFGNQIGDLGDKGHGGAFFAMATGFSALGDDDVEAGIDGDLGVVERLHLLDGDGARGFDLGNVGRWVTE